MCACLPLFPLNIFAKNGMAGSVNVNILHLCGYCQVYFLHRVNLALDFCVCPDERSPGGDTKGSQHTGVWGRKEAKGVSGNNSSEVGRWCWEWMKPTPLVPLALRRGRMQGPHGVARHMCCEMTATSQLPIPSRATNLFNLPKVHVYLENFHHWLCSQLDLQHLSIYVPYQI